MDWNPFNDPIVIHLLYLIIIFFIIFSFPLWRATLKKFLKIVRGLIISFGCLLKTGVSSLLNDYCFDSAPIFLAKRINALPRSEVILLFHCTAIFFVIKRLNIFVYIVLTKFGCFACNSIIYIKSGYAMCLMHSNLIRM